MEMPALRSVSNDFRASSSAMDTQMIAAESFKLETNAAICVSFQVGQADCSHYLLPALPRPATVAQLYLDTRVLQH